MDFGLQRYHRDILKDFCSKSISNDDLYKRCYVEPLAVRVGSNRSRMLVLVLRGPIDGSAYGSRGLAVLRASRRTANYILFSLIRSDLSERN